MMAQTFCKDPDERLDYDIDFGRWLPDGDTIASAIAVASGGSVTIDTVEPSDTAVRVWVTGGSAGESNSIVVTATTAAGRIKEFAFRLKIMDTV